jgi:hypothetical protein
LAAIRAGWNNYLDGLTHLRADKMRPFGVRLQYTRTSTAADCSECTTSGAAPLVHGFDFEQRHCFNKDVNYTLIDSVPKGVFEEISIDQQFINKTDDYEERFSLFIDRVLSLIEQRKPIKYTLAGMPTLPKKIIDALVKQNYEHQILKSDNNFHFLVPS